MNFQLFIKRVLDLIAACLLLALFSPIFIFVGLIIFLKDGMPIFFTQERIGMKEKPFTIIKFRTMKNAVKDGPELSDKERAFPLGSLLRKLSLDELPQLINIIKGDISFVGPRPLLKEYLPLYSSEQKKRHSVIPGITGWAQINGRNQINWNKKFELDVWYVENWSLWLDLKIFFKTIFTVLGQKGINNSRNETMPKFNGSN